MAVHYFKFYFTTCIIAFLAYHLCKLDYNVPEEFSFLTVDYIKKYGYESEEHELESADGFVTKIYRLLPPKSPGKYNQRGPPVLIEGGIFCSSDVMVLKGPGSDIGYILVDAGYDVWLGNYRGTRYSFPGPNANHTDPHLLYYGYHEMGIYDFAATIDYIIENTGHPKVNCIAVSVGSGSLLALLASKPEYNTKINKALHFGSGLALKLDKAYQKVFFWLLWNAPWLAVKTKILEPFALRSLLVLLACERTFLTSACMRLLDESTGLPDGANKTLSAIMLTLLPSGTPVGVVDHLMQLSDEGSEFRMRDYGTDENLRRYRGNKPPVYDIGAITVPTKAYYAFDDGLVKEKMAKEVFRKLPNFVGEYTVKPPFCHANFFIASGKSREFINDVLRTLST